MTAIRHFNGEISFPVTPSVSASKMSVVKSLILLRSGKKTQNTFPMTDVN